MTKSRLLPEQLPKLTVALRSAGERSFHACKALLLAQVPESCVQVVTEVPFESALMKTYEIGIECGDEWLMSLDADVFLREGAVATLFSAAKNLPRRYFQIEGLVQDKLTGIYRKAGHRMYRTKYLKTALRLMPAPNTEIRPEYVTLQRMEATGFPSLEIKSVMGVHDYEQFFRDIYRKAFVHANKHQIWLPQLISRWKKLAVEDDDFLIALRGLYDGLVSLANVKIDTRDYGAAARRAIGDLGLQEKPPLSVQAIDFKQIEAILADSDDIINNQTSRSLEARLERFRSRYYRLGALRMVPYLFGSILCDIGTKIKQLADYHRLV
jgi:hypothetical protein